MAGAAACQMSSAAGNTRAADYAGRGWQPPGPACLGGKVDERAAGEGAVQGAVPKVLWGQAGGGGGGAGGQGGVDGRTGGRQRLRVVDFCQARVASQPSAARVIRHHQQQLPLNAGYLVGSVEEEAKGAHARGARRVVARAGLHVVTCGASGLGWGWVRRVAATSPIRP